MYFHIIWLVMRKLIIERIKVLQSEKLALNKVNTNPNEFELGKDVYDLFKKELDSLIDEGCITVNGHTINKHRILIV